MTSSAALKPCPNTKRRSSPLEASDRKIVEEAADENHDHTAEDQDEQLEHDVYLRPLESTEKRTRKQDAANRELNERNACGQSCQPFDTSWTQARGRVGK